MVSNKMIHYEKILASREFLKNTKSCTHINFDFYRELNDIERVFQDTKNLIDEELGVDGVLSKDKTKWYQALGSLNNIVGSNIKG